jgi:fermentation-respiration switch protein FrsA (DUF1100 family)
MAQNYLNLYARLARVRRLPALKVAGARDEIVARSLLTYTAAANAATRDSAPGPVIAKGEGAAL